MRGRSVEKVARNRFDPRFGLSPEPLKTAERMPARFDPFPPRCRGWYDVGSRSRLTPHHIGPNCQVVRIMIKRILLLVLLAAALVSLLAYSQRLLLPLSVSGIIEADEIRVGSRVGGRVEKVNIEEGQAVRAGDVMVVLEPFDLVERRAEAAAKQASAQAQYDQLSAGYRVEEVAQAKAHYDQLAAHLAKLRAGPRKQTVAAARARLDAAQGELNLAKQSYARLAQLVTRNAATKGDMDNATEQLSTATAMLVVRQQELAELEEGTRKEDILEAEAQLEAALQQWQLRKHGFRKEEIAAAKATLDAATAALKKVERQIDELQIKTPVDGVIEAVELQPGDLVTAGAPVLSIMDTRRLWMRAYVPEDRLQFTTGQRVDVTVDSFRGALFEGEVTFVSRQAEFTPSNVQTPDERSKQVFRIKVLLRTGHDRLRPGMAGNVHFGPPRKTNHSAEGT
jgi:multidrug resistance efflux pump